MGAFTVLATVATLLGPVSAQAIEGAKPVDAHKIWSPPATPLPRTASVAGKDLPAPSHLKPRYPVPKAWAGPAAASSASGAAQLTVPGAPASGRPQPARAGRLPVWIRPAARPARTTTAAGRTATIAPSAAGTPVSVSVVAPASAAKAGFHGPVVSVARSTAGPAGEVEVGVDVSQLDAAFGGDAASRSHLVEIPQCALTSPQNAACQKQTPVPSHYDPATHRLIADATVPTATTAGSQSPDVAVAAPSLLLAAQTSSGGGGGTYAATSLNPSGAWSAGSSNGGFGYSYPIQVPPAIAGDAPAVSLSYDSSSVDGLTSSTNSQASWIGDGWNYSPGYVERSYTSCDLDGLPHSNDMCWGGYNATLSLGGQSSTLVRDDTSGTWRLQDDNGSKVEFLTGASNGTSTGEYIKVSTTSGTVYYFGLNHLPGGDKTDPATNSAWSEPVYSPKSTDPCYDATKGNASWCQMGWRFNLDYAVDAHGNLTTYTYSAESNYYKRGAGQNSGTGTLTSYTRGGALTSIAYGQRLPDQVTAKGALKPAAKVIFTPDPAGRCSTAGGFTCTNATLSATNAAHWPDVPYDQNCASTGTCNNYGPTFWSNIRLASITTQVQSAGALKDIDTYTLSQSYPDPNDGNKPTQWLDSIVRTGKDGTPNIPLPPVTFTAANMPNRVDGTDLVPAPTIFDRPRIQSITTETGEHIQVDYKLPACSRINHAMPASADTDTAACYNVLWYPPGTVYGADPASDWFNRYQVDSVTQNDPVTGSLPVVTHYAYGPAAWHYNDAELTDPKTRTWDQFRGYATVTATTGSGQDGPVSQTVTTYLQGMDGDKTAGGTRSVTVSDRLGDHVTDSDWLSGQALETDTYDQAGGSVTAYKVTTATSPSAATATHVRGTGLPDLVARYDSTVSVATTKGLKADGTWRTAVTTARTDSGNANRTVSVDAVADGEPEQCTLTSYATSSNPLMTGLPDEVKTLTGTGACSATPTKANTVSDDRTVYDGLAFGSAGPLGEVTSAQTIDSYDASNHPAFVTTVATAYDTYGRVNTVTDPNATDTQHSNGATTTTVYTPARAGELPATVSIANSAPGTAADWTTSTTVDIARGLPLTATDLNGQTTTESYDALGRLTKVWAAGRTTAQNPALTHTYAINGSAGPSTVTTATLMNDGPHYDLSVQYFDGFGRPRQTQTTSGISAYHGRILTDTFYDSHGRAVETRSPWYDDTAAPGAGLFTTADNHVPGETTTVYDGQDRPTASVFSSFAVEQWRTTTAYRGVDATDTTPPKGGTATTVITDAAGRASQLWQYKTAAPTGHASDADVTAYTYTPSGNPATRTDSTNQDTWSYAYDLRGRQVSATDPDTGTTTQTYDTDGRLATTTDARKVTLSYAYDLVGRTTAEHSTTYPSTTSMLQAAWTYDTLTGAKGQPVKSTRYVNGDTTQAYTTETTGYDTGYRPTGTKVTLPASEGALQGPYTTQAIYDPITGALTASHTDARGNLPAETVTYSYDANGPLLGFGSSATTYDLATNYDAFGRPTRTTVNPWGTEIVATDNYDQATGSLLSSYLDKQTASTGQVQQTTYLRNPAGQITAVQNIADNTPSQTDLQCFTDDYLGRLTTAWTDTGGTTTQPQPEVPNIGGCKNTTPTSGAASGHTTIGGPAAYWTSYAYDSRGNRTGLTKYDITGDSTKNITTTQTFGQPGQPNTPTTAANTGGGTGGPHALLSTTSTGLSNPGASTYQYDALGNTTAVTATAGTTTLDWTAEDQLADVTPAGGAGKTSYVYDADGNQLLRRDPGKTTLTFGGDELVLDTSTGTVTDTRTYQLPNGLTAVRQGTGLTWQVSDLHGTPTLALDSLTLAETRRPADPFGNPRGTQPTSWAGDHGFVGGTQDPATGLTNLGAREYQPSTGRFLNPDPLLDSSQPQQWNGYAYAGNDPLNSSDPTGLRSECGQNGDAPCDPDAAPAGGGTSTCSSYGTCPAPAPAPANGAPAPATGASTPANSSCDRTCQDMAKPDPTTTDGYTEIYPNVVIRNDTKDFSRYRQLVYKYIREGCSDDSYDCLDPTAYDTPQPVWKIRAWINKLYTVQFNACAQLRTCTWKDTVQAIAGLKGIEMLMSTGGGGRAQELLSADEAADFGAEKTAPGCVVNSFPGETNILTSSGKLKNIDRVKVGDAIVATSPITGETKPEKVTAVIRTLTDTDFTDITVSAGGALTSTQHHPYWDVTHARWMNAADLRKGDALRLPDGGTTRVQSVRNYTSHIVTYNLTVSDLHTYYVLAGTTPILVHNGPGSDPATFPNLYPEDTGGWTKVFTPGTVAQRTGNYQYVVLTDGTLMIGKGDGHIALTGGADVLAAGEVRFKSGRMTEVNNRSGHYKPYGANAESAAVDAFNNAGLDATGKYVEYEFPC
ncbi:RHS repeat-associated core domain-containing protein [Streptomyces polygonati]|uniref:RHS repeat-associated core domain-containing protein n=1 Tax=Streptomyces polygonati TaxID=1617087 RepID=A0ABV8HYS8_9ACTN